MHNLSETISGIRPPDQATAEAARRRQDALTKPPGSLGRLEELAIRIAGIRRTPRPKIAHKAVFVMAGDHGICAKGVSRYPQEVTGQMVKNFLAGGAAINILANWAGARVVVTDCGMKASLPEAPGFHVRKIGSGTRDMSEGPAMTRDEAIRSIEAGIDVFEGENAAYPLDIAATGDMGIGNTSSSAAITAVLAGVPVESVTGRGAGLDSAALAKKISVIKGAIDLNKPDPSDALDLLSKMGGFEIGGIAGVILAAAAHGIPVCIDGFISTAAALVANGLCPLSAAYMIAAHRSAEPGHAVALEKLGLSPILDLGMRLGEGTGAVLAMSICDAACRLMDEMASFEEAGVSKGEV